MTTLTRNLNAARLLLDALVTDPEIPPIQLLRELQSFRNDVDLYIDIAARKVLDPKPDMG